MIIYDPVSCKQRKLTARQARAFKCNNMRYAGYCGSFPEGAPDRRCPIVFPRPLYDTKEEAEVYTDHCPFKGCYGFHEEGVEK